MKEREMKLARKKLEKEQLVLKELQSKQAEKDKRKKQVYKFLILFFLFRKRIDDSIRESKDSKRNLSFYEC